jgi:hypothetical protein
MKRLMQANDFVDSRVRTIEPLWNEGGVRVYTSIRPSDIIDTEGGTEQIKLIEIHVETIRRGN